MSSVLNDLANSVTGLDPSDLTVSTVTNSAFMVKAGLWLKTGLYIGLLAIGIGYWYKFIHSYKIRITVFRRLGGGGVDKLDDRALIHQDEHGKKKLVFMKLKNGKRNATVNIPPANFRLKQGKHDHYIFWQDDNGELHPTLFNSPVLEHPYLAPVPQERTAWAHDEEKIQKDKLLKQTWWDKNKDAVITISAFMTAFLIFFFMAQNLGKGLEQCAGGMEAVANACLKLGGIPQ